MTARPRSKASAACGGQEHGPKDTEARAQQRSSVTRLVRKAVLVPVFAYSKLISPALPRRCRYEPTCSAYAIEAVRRFGILRGSVLAAWRLLRCNPFSDGGYDPVDAQRLFERPSSWRAEGHR